jgi:hypothetical protein
MSTSDTENSRKQFRESVFTRDNYHCVLPGCTNQAQDAHHIIERALWKDSDEEGGYLLDNGASVCGKHHIHAEKNFFPPQALRDWAGIERRVIPKQLDSSFIYDKWGVKLNPPNRQEWELIKYPHTPYLTFSPSVDEKDLSDSGYFDITNFVDKPSIMTIKMDGSNLLMCHEKVTARNGYDARHKSFDLAKAIHAGVKDLIPEGVQIFGEWLYAKHSIHYTDKLAIEGSLFQPFAVYDRQTQLWLSWSEVEMWAKKLGFCTTKVVGHVESGHGWEIEREIITQGERVIKNGHEGVVVRSIYPFHYSQFKYNVAKYVRANHVQTDEHWSQQPLVKNQKV